MESIRALCAMAVFSAVLLELMPEGGVRRIASVLASSALILLALGGLGQIDLDYYAREKSRLREEQAVIQAGGEAMNERLSRLVIAQELETYILDKAEELGVPVIGAELSLAWSPEGFWVPRSATIHVKGRSESEHELSRILEAELGIPLAEQEWKRDE